MFQHRLLRQKRQTLQTITDHEQELQQRERCNRSQHLQSQTLRSIHPG